MKIEKAIEILTHYKVEGEAPCPPALDDALQLGIEALKRVQNQRKYDVDPHRLPLRGETM